MTSSICSQRESTSQYLARAAETARDVFRHYPQHALDEQAGPAYLQGCALSRWIFWQRLKKVIALLPMQGESCLDFGCGFGMLLPLLQRRFTSVYGIDLMPDLATAFLQTWAEKDGETLTQIRVASDIRHHGLGEGSLDLILMLDVLEHMDSLDTFLPEMTALLKPDGMLIVTGPTENWVYKLGRWMVGFVGDYHVHNIDDIRAEMAYSLHVERVGRVFYPLTLFHLLKGTPRRST